MTGLCRAFRSFALPLPIALILGGGAAPLLGDRLCSGEETAALLDGLGTGLREACSSFIKVCAERRASASPGDLEACIGKYLGADGVASVGESLLFCDGSFQDPEGWCWKLSDVGPGCDSRQQDVCFVYESAGAAQAILEVRRDEGIAIQIATSDPLDLDVCQARIQRGERIVVGPRGGRIVVPVAAPTDCAWTINSSSGRIEDEGKFTLGNRDVWMDFGAGEGGGEVTVTSGGAVQDRRSIVSTPSPRECVARDPAGQRRLPYYALSDSPDADPCARRFGSGPPPIFLLPEGPGMSPGEFLMDGRLGLLQSVAGERPLILAGVRDNLRRRGGGQLSQSKLSCPFQSIVLPFDEPASEEGLLLSAAILPFPFDRNTIDECRAQREEKKHQLDLDDYRIEALVDDLEALRQELRGDAGDAGERRRVVLWGEGWGAKLALAYLSRYPDAVEAAVLHAPRPLGKTVTDPLDLDAVLRQVEGGMEGAVTALAQDLDASEPSLLVRQPTFPSRVERGLGEVPIVVGSYDLQQAVAAHLLDRRRFAVLRQGLAAGRTGALELIRATVDEQVRAGCDSDGGPVMQGRRIATRGECLGSSLTYIADCAISEPDDEPPPRRRTVLGRVLDEPYPGTCEYWQLSGEPVDIASCEQGGRCRGPNDTIDVLMISASLDPLATESDVDRVTARLESPGVQVSRVALIGGSHADLFDPRLEHGVEGTPLSDFLAGQGTPFNRRVTIPSMTAGELAAASRPEGGSSAASSQPAESGSPGPDLASWIGIARQREAWRELDGSGLFRGPQPPSRTPLATGAPARTRGELLIGRSMASEPGGPTAAESRRRGLARRLD